MDSNQDLKISSIGEGATPLPDPKIAPGETFTIGPYVFEIKKVMKGGRIMAKHVRGR